MGLVDQRPQVGPRAQRIGSLRHGHHARPPVEQVAQAFGHQPARVVERQHPHLRPAALRGQLPRHQVGVVLHLADDDVVAFVQEPFAPGIGHRVERRRRPGCENDLLAAPGPDKRADALAGLLVTGRGLFGQIMHAAVDVGVELAVEVIHRLDHAAGLLGRCAAVEINERFAIDLTFQNREIPAYACYIQHGYIFSSFSATAPTSASRTASSGQRRTMSSTKPSICRLRACWRLNPRWRM